MVLVFYNGSDDLSYLTVDLSGNTIPANDFFVIGSALVSNVDLVAFTSNGLQNGADAVGLYFGTPAEFPNSTPVTTVGLMDAVVYDTNDGDDSGLLALTPGKPQVNESANGDSENESVARVPDGGAAFDTTLYVTQAPTPGATNTVIVTGFASWIDTFYPGSVDPLEIGFDADPDKDGISNGAEAIFGLAPDEPNGGIFTDIALTGNEFTFVIPMADSPPSGVTPSYEWSTDLANWQGDGGSFGGVTVTFAAPLLWDDQVTPNLYQIKATITAGTPVKIFVRVVANNP